jgi:uncharacterized protein YcbK (DUF882 family)
MLARRNLLRLGLAAAAGAGLGVVHANAAPLPLVPAAARKVALHNLHTGEKLSAVYYENGRYAPDVMQAVNHVLRDYRTGDVHMIDPRLLDLLDAVTLRTGSKDPVQVICGYRSPKTNAMLHQHSEQVAQHSLHLKGQAIDIRLDDAALPHLHDAALKLGAGGVGYYPVSNFVHVDVGPVRRWQGT